MPFNGEHYWELGRNGVTIKKINRIIEKYFIIEKEWLDYRNTYHYFWLFRACT